MDIPGNLYRIKNQLPEYVKLVAVSKTQSDGAILQAYAAGQRDFGENKAQEMAAKFFVLPKDIHWHYIGHLQSNKAKLIIPFVHMIHSVDSLRLAEVINKEARKVNRVVDTLLQIHIASEETKFGFGFDELEALLKEGKFMTLNNLRLRGVMGMATFTEDEGIVREEFSKLVRFFNSIRNSFLKDLPDFNEISIGMSDDYRIAVEEGSTMVRIGSSVFGPRFYV
jgi:pyridoxal phosphate enzyme (YggS family)